MNPSDEPLSAEEETKWRLDNERVIQPSAFTRRVAATIDRERHARLRLREALLLHVETYGGADHHPQDCEYSETCLQCRTDALANEALK